MVDNEDITILNILKKDSSLSIRKIAELAKIPPTTVHSRIQKLKRSGVIKRYTIDIDLEKLGRPLIAYICINYSYTREQRSKSQKEIMVPFINHPAVEQASIVTGEFDVILRARFSDIKEMNEFIARYLRGLDVVRNTQTMVVLFEAEKEERV